MLATGFGTFIYEGHLGGISIEIVTANAGEGFPVRWIGRGHGGTSHLSFRVHSDERS